MLLQIYMITSVLLTDLFEDNKVQHERDVRPFMRGILLGNFICGIYWPNPFHQILSALIEHLRSANTLSHIQG